MQSDPHICRFRLAYGTCDDSFAEAHGSLAVTDAMEGRVESARRRLEIALRLDRQSFSAALAGVLIESGEGNPNAAREIFDAALKQSITADGKSLGTILTAPTRRQ